MDGNPIVLAYASFAGLAAFDVLVTGWLSKWWKWDGKKAAALSWLVPFALVAIGYFAGFGYLAGQTLAHAALEAIGIALMANGLFSYPATKTAMSWAGATQPSVERHMATTGTP